MKNVLLAVVSFMILFLNCSDKEEIARLNNVNKELRVKYHALEHQLEKYKTSDAKLKFLASKIKGVQAVIVTNYGDIKIGFFLNDAPLHCYSFITRAESGFYDNTRFHRIIKGFMIQGGDPNSKDKDPSNDGKGGPLINTPHEFNNIPHKRGIVSMARVGDQSAGAGSQFFIMHGDNPSLNNQYTVFGEVLKGMKVVDKIASVKKNFRDPPLKDQPLKPVIIKTIKVSR